jgi:hypothetical protein
VEREVIRRIRDFFVGKNDSGRFFSPLEQLVLFGEVSDEIVDVKGRGDAHEPSE